MNRLQKDMINVSWYFFKFALDSNEPINCVCLFVLFLLVNLKGFVILINELKFVANSLSEDLGTIFTIIVFKT